MKYRYRQNAMRCKALYLYENEIQNRKEKQKNEE